MKKWLLFFGSFALIVYTIFLSYIYIYRAEFASTFLSRSFASHANVEKMEIHSDAIILENITLSSPYGYSTKPAFFAKEIVCTMPRSEQLTAFFSYGDAQVSKISINDASFHIETLHQRSEDSNWKVLLTNAQERYKYNPGSRKLLLGPVQVNSIEATFKADVTEPEIAKIETVDTVVITDVNLQKEPHTALYLLFTVVEQIVGEIEKKRVAGNNPVAQLPQNSIL